MECPLTRWLGRCAPALQLVTARAQAVKSHQEHKAAAEGQAGKKDGYRAQIFAIEDQIAALALEQQKAVEGARQLTKDVAASAANAAAAASGPRYFNGNK